MGKIGQQLFGGGSSESQSSFAPVDLTSPEMVALRKKFSETLQTLLGGGEPAQGVVSGTPGYSDTGQPLAAPIGANEQAMLDKLFAQGTDPTSGDYLKKVISGAFLPGGAQQNPFLQAAIEAAQRPTLQGLEETLSRTLPGRFTQAGQFVQPEGSSAFDRAAAIATRGAGQTMADIATKLSAGAYETERTAQQQAIQLSQQEVQTTVANLNAQALPRLIQELGIERGIAEYNTRLDTILKALSVATGAPLTTIAQQGSSSSSADQYTGAVNSISKLISSIFPMGAT
jgi:hypothetical protein